VGASIIPLVTDSSGVARSDIELKVDGVQLAARLDGTALPIEAGEHELAFSSGGAVFATQRVMIADGQQRRLVQVELFTAAPQPPAALRPRAALAESNLPGAMRLDAVGERGEMSTTTKVLTGLFLASGLSAIGAGGLLTWWGRSDNDALQSCTPWCASSAVQHVKNLYLAADIAIGAGLATVALGVACWLYGLYSLGAGAPADFGPNAS
jgi:hypothetical protein